MKQEVYDRFKNYDKEHCWQYEIRQQNLEQDLLDADLTIKEYGNLRTDDFDFLYICLLYTSPSPRDKRQSRMPSSA